MKWFIVAAIAAACSLMKACPDIPIIPGI